MLRYYSSYGVNMKRIPNVSSIWEIVERHKLVQQMIKNRLCDYADLWIGFTVLTNGDTYQKRKENSKWVSERVDHGWNAFPYPETYEWFVKWTAKIPDTHFTEHDRVHLQELSSLVDYTREKIVKNRGKAFPAPEGKLIGNYLSVMWYGQYGLK